MKSPKIEAASASVAEPSSSSTARPDLIVVEDGSLRSALEAQIAVKLEILTGMAQPQLAEARVSKPVQPPA